MEKQLEDLSDAELDELVLKKQAQESASSSNSSNWVSNALRGATGFAVGVAETANPLAVPRNLELIARAPFEEADPNKSFFDRVSERFESADKKAIIPNVTIKDISSFMRAVDPERGRIENKGFAQLLNEERAAQESFENEWLPEGSKKAGEVGGALASLASLLKDAALKAPGAVKSIKNLANLKSFESLKPIGKSADKIIDQGRAQQIGQQLLKDKIVTTGASYKDILSRSRKKLSEYGEKIGYFVKTADDAVARDSSLRGIPVSELSDEIRSRVVMPLLNDPSTRGIANNVDEWVNGLQVATKGQDLTFKKAQDFKNSLDKMKAQFSKSGDSLSREAFQDVYRILNTRMEDGIDSILKTSAPGITNDFKETKTAYRNLMDAEDFISKTVARMSKNRTPSPTDYIALAGGGITGGVIGGPLGVILGPALAATNYVARTRGNQAASSFLNSIAQSEKTGKALKNALAVESIGSINAIQPKKEGN